MQTPLLLIAAILVLASLYVVLPVVADAFLRYRGVKKPTCPETGAAADVLLDAGHAAMTAAFGKPDLRVRQCSRWPEHEGCDEGCTKEVDSALS